MGKQYYVILTRQERAHLQKLIRTAPSADEMAFPLDVLQLSLSQPHVEGGRKQSRSGVVP